MEYLKKIKEDKVLFIDIETARVSETLALDTPEFDAWAYKHNKPGLLSNEDLQQLYVDKAALEPEFAKVICISMGMIVNNGIAIKSYAGDDEGQLLRDFNHDLEVTQSNVRGLMLGGWAVVGFDVPFIFKRCMVNRIRPCSLLETAGEKPWTLTEKLLDLKDLWKGTAFYPTSLICASVAMGLPHSKDDISGADVGRVYYEEGAKGLERIRIYCEKDVWNTANLFRALRFEELLELPGDSREGLKVERAPLIEALANGVAFGAAIKKKVQDFVDDLSEKERPHAIDILQALAEDKSTKVTKTFVQTLKDKYAAITQE
jgi:hypothetical protein